MFLGHYAVALAAKGAAPRISLARLILAAQLVDLIWPMLLLLGLEHVRIAPGDTAFTPLDFYDYPYTHSFLAALMWSLLAGAGVWTAYRRVRDAVVLGLVVFSHWLLDVLSHRPDLPLAPGSDIHIGLGLWNNVAATIVVECLLFVVGAALYQRSTKAKDGTGTAALYGMLAFLAVIYVVNVFGPPPPNVDAIGWAGLLLWLFIPWAWWIEKHRSVV
ncbi:MAG: hypothetical protein HY962_14435 [Ignavibacteriae bacterium]|nr:hypothetical protein [Ignavibacteriota bacterium]